MEEKINILDELHKGTCMGMDAIKFILDKVKDENLKSELKHQYQEYEKIALKLNKLYPEDVKPKTTSIFNKAMTWYGIEMNTIKDDTTSKLAELLVQGTNMGIIEGRKLLNHKDTNKEISKLIDEYVTMQEKALDKLKNFL